MPKTMEDSDGLPLFAFQDLDYIPSGFGGILAPYIETTAGTMRAAATLMRLGFQTEEDDKKGGNETLIAHQEVVCDLGCGDGYFLISLLAHISLLTPLALPIGLGIDYDPSLIASAGIASSLQKVNASWLIYNFNDDREDLVSQLIDKHQVTHMFVYLVPKQLALGTVRRILTSLCGSGVVVCCHKFYPEYLTPARRDALMELAVYDESS
ncbi:hypothetical protein NA56DRAFT_362400 [Hyaloscypha hepaticicola]|uniref:Methyltransferase domain-containing protein n=1 Tax=Hyaloscypha hepaticicola TaxID=2082293 RepID=A0A2J6PLP7_9HELO|nr:hypothetical protein NA56DRAFT_362400 [Hyaloscypha hepaticicola]